MRPSSHFTHSFTYIWLAGLLALCGLLGLLTAPVAAAPEEQVYYNTPTPDADGRIVYEVKSGETCLSISLLTGVSIDQIRELNSLDEECALRVGQELLLAVATAVAPTPGPSATPTAILPSPTPFNGTGEICVYLFEDINGNGVPEDTESGIVAGAISLTDRVGKVSLTGATLGTSDPVCFSDLEEGQYNVSVGVPEGYNPTTQLNAQLDVYAGESSYVDFGAQLNSSAQPLSTAEGGTSPLLGILGVVVLLGGAGLGFFALRNRRWKIK
jgi:murein DD-endopeptidase MepM/ murein hydrolase activator NlpD